MAATLLGELLDKEEEWRASNPEWKRKLAQYEEWLSRAKDRERAAARATKNKVDPDEAKMKTVEWQATFDPNAPLPQFSFAGQHTSYTQSMLEEELKHLVRWTSTPQWALFCLQRGIAVHHAGMNKRYRTIVERRAIVIWFVYGTLNCLQSVSSGIRSCYTCNRSFLMRGIEVSGSNEDLHRHARTRYQCANEDVCLLWRFAIPNSPHGASSPFLFVR
jgi:hypothetical protein